MNAQSVFLFKSKATIRKTASLGNHQDVQTYVPDSIGWHKELEILHEINAINKPRNHDLYKVEPALNDSKSNLMVSSFTATENLPVKSLRIYYQQSHEKIRRIEADLSEGNTLYKGAKSLTLEFQEINQQAVLTSYVVDGGQKMYLDDSVQYKIQVAITLPN